LLNILPYSGIGTLLTIGGFGVIGFFGALVGLFALFYTHKFKITPECKNKNESSSQKKSNQMIEDNEVDLGEERAKADNKEDEFQKYLKEDPIKTPFEEKYMKRYGNF
jgi:UPF0716 family protein affecting phage T7 exclusion